MLYISTRGNSPEVNFNIAITQGLAPDGGLYVPKTWPKLSKEVLENAKTAPYYETAAQVLVAFAGDDINIETAREICKSAYGTQWDDKDIVPTRKIYENTSLLELYFGPSLAFKDVAMQMIGALYEHILGAKNQKLSVICATSGDTGGAAVEAFKNKASVELFVLMPEGRVSEVQKRFMTASNADNVHAIIMNGDFDKAQALLKGLFADKDFVNEVKLAPVNSVNFARIVAQCVYFVISSAKMGQTTNYIVPTGNFGDALSGFVAKKLGADIGKFIIANNANNAISNALETGRFEVGANSIATISPAMDIQIASNFERILYELSDGSPHERSQMIVESYNSLKTNLGFNIDPSAINNLKEFFIPSTINDDTTRIAIKDCFEKTKEVICPHTAVGWASLDKLKSEATIILATAHAAKFPETTEEVLGIHPALPNHAKDLFERKENFVNMQSDSDTLKTFIRANI